MFRTPPTDKQENECVLSSAVVDGHAPPHSRVLVPFRFS